MVRRANEIPGAGRFTDPITYSIMWDEDGNIIFPKTRKAQLEALRREVHRETNADGSLTGKGRLMQAQLDYLLTQKTTIGDSKLTGTLKKSDAKKLKDFALQQRDRTCSRLAGEICGKDGPMDCPCGSAIKPNHKVLSALDAFGRQRLSKHYWMRDFLYSEVAEAHGIANVPDDAELAIKAGKAVCRNLLEPLRRVFGHVTIRSAFRSANVNGFCNCHNMNCSSNEASYANHIWDHLDGDGFMGATVCIVIPDFVDWMNEQAGRDWQVLAWFIHDHLPYSEMVFFVQNAAVNLTWRGDPRDRAHEGDVAQFDGSVGSVVWRSQPKHKVLSFAKPKGLLIKNGEPCRGRYRSECYVDLLHHLHGTSSRAGLEDYLRHLREAKRDQD